MVIKVSLLMRRLSIPEAARLLNVPEQAIWKKIERGNLQYSKENGRIFVHIKEAQQQEQTKPAENFSDEEYFETPLSSSSEQTSKQSTTINDNSFETFLKNLLEQKDSQLENLKDENRELHEKLESALRENNQLSQGVHLEARKLLEIILPNYNMKQLESESKTIKQKGEKKKKKKKS